MDIAKPGRLFVWMLVVNVAIFLLGIFLFPYRSMYGIFYFYAFPLSTGLILAIASYRRDIRAGDLRIYISGLIILYLIVTIVSSMSGIYLLMSSPSTVNAYANDIAITRLRYDSVFSLSRDLFLENVVIDLISYVPIIGIFLLGYSVMSTGSLIWALNLSGYHIHPLTWYMGLLQTFLAPYTPMELASYGLAAYGGIYLIRLIGKKSSIQVEGSNRKYLQQSLTLLFASIALLYISAVIEAILIL
ncbi:MAG: hypothetical protein M1388_01645 [Thaumarchaeota archaeon]|nr:hypothetical protein [Nitrososphaerota archaeon]